MARAIQLSAELNNPAHLTKDNLHEYRLKVKELRNVLKLSDQAGDSAVLDQLDEVKDAIGAWHDWEVLIAIGGKLLDHGPRCRVMRQLRDISESKYEHAVSVANRLRSDLVTTPGKPSGRGAKVASIAVLKAASTLVE